MQCLWTRLDVAISLTAAAAAAVERNAHKGNVGSSQSPGVDRSICSITRGCAHMCARVQRRSETDLLAVVRCRMRYGCHI